MFITKQFSSHKRKGPPILDLIIQYRLKLAYHYQETYKGFGFF